MIVKPCIVFFLHPLQAERGFLRRKKKKRQIQKVFHQSYKNPNKLVTNLLCPNYIISKLPVDQHDATVTPLFDWIIIMVAQNDVTLTPLFDWIIKLASYLLHIHNVNLDK